MKQKPHTISRRLRALLAGLCITAVAPMAVALSDDKNEAKPTGSNEVEAAVKTGNDPRDFSHRITPYYRYDKRRGGIETQDAMLFFMVPFSFPGWGTPSAFTFESPIVRWREIDDGPDDSGTADWTMRIILKPWVTDFAFNTKASHVFFMETTMPTGNEALSNDQTILSPGYGPIISNSPNWFFAPIFFYDNAIENDGVLEDAHRLRGRIFYQYAWKNGVYVLPETQVIWDLNEGTFTANILPEIGWVYKRPPKLKSSLRPTASPGAAIYFKAGPGIDNSNPGDLDYRIEIGHRFLW